METTMGGSPSHFPDRLPVGNSILICGFGAPYGDDAVGWVVARSVELVLAGDERWRTGAAGEAGLEPIRKRGQTPRDDFDFSASKQATRRRPPFSDRILDVAILRTPADLLDRLPLVPGDARRPGRLVICDGCVGLGAPGTWRRASWPTEDVSALRGSGSHDLSLADVLALARQLNCLPDDVVLWLIEIDPTTVNPDRAQVGEPTLASLSHEVAIAASAVSHHMLSDF